MFWKGDNLSVAGGQKGLAVVAVCPRRNKGVLFSFISSGNFLTLTVSDLSNLARKDGWLSGVHIKKRTKTARTLI